MLGSSQLPLFSYFYFKLRVFLLLLLQSSNKVAKFVIQNVADKAGSHMNAAVGGSRTGSGSLSLIKHVNRDLRGN